MHMDFGNLVGLVQVAQQLISPPRLLPAIPYGPWVLSLSQSVSSSGMSSCSMKSRYLSPFPPNFSLGSYEQVYSLLRSLVFQMPTTMISLILPCEVNSLMVFWTSQAVPKAAWLLLKRFCPSCIKRTSYFLRVLSKQEGGQQMLHFLELPNILEATLLLSTILLAAGRKLGNISIVLSPPIKILLLPNIQAESLRRSLTLTATFSEHIKAVFHQLAAVLLRGTPFDHVKLQPSPRMQICCPPRFASGQQPTNMVQTAFGGASLNENAARTNKQTMEIFNIEKQRLQFGSYSSEISEVNKRSLNIEIVFGLLNLFGPAVPAPCFVGRFNFPEPAAGHHVYEEQREADEEAQQLPAGPEDRVERGVVGPQGADSHPSEVEQNDAEVGVLGHAHFRIDDEVGDQAVGNHYANIDPDEPPHERRWLVLHEVGQAREGGPGEARVELQIEQAAVVEEGARGQGSQSQVDHEPVIERRVGVVVELREAEGLGEVEFGEGEAQQEEIDNDDDKAKGLVCAKGAAADDLVDIGVIVVVVAHAPLHVADVREGLVVQRVVSLQRGPCYCCEADRGGRGHRVAAQVQQLRPVVVPALHELAVDLQKAEVEGEDRNNECNQPLREYSDRFRPVLFDKRHSPSLLGES